MSFGWKRYTTITAALVYFWTALTPGAQSAPDKPRHDHRQDCRTVASNDRALCREVQRQRAYGWTYGPNGEGLALNPNGYTDVHDVTHQDYTRREIHDNLTGLRQQYREHVTRVTVNVDKLRPGCHYTVKTLRREGITVTQVRTVCP